MPDVQEKISNWNMLIRKNERHRTVKRKADGTSGAGQTEDFPLTWHTYSFVLPLQPEGVWFPYHLRLEHSGNGFVYLNGHCIGRCWQKGPQYEYYLPECWLNFGGENHLVISLRPTADGAEIRKAEIVPITQVAEKKKRTL